MTLIVYSLHHLRVIISLTISSRYVKIVTFRKVLPKSFNNFQLFIALAANRNSKLDKLVYKFVDHIRNDL